jgi:hypothetical protein
MENRSMSDRESREARLQRREERLQRRARREESLKAKAEGLPQPGRKSARRVARVAAVVKAQTYLEIGVSQGRTFRAVGIPHRVGVDPGRRFDPAHYPGERFEFHNVTSDAFFASYSRSSKFDVIFIDGLHVFDQAYRDLINSLAHAHERTVWLIDDVNPGDEFAAIPDHDRAVAERLRVTGVKRGMWQGDVYKVMLALHDLHPEFSYATIAERNWQSIVWRQPRPVQPLFGSVEAIDKVGYHEFVEHRDRLLNAMTEDEAVAALQTGLGSP